MNRVAPDELLSMENLEKRGTFISTSSAESPGRVPVAGASAGGSVRLSLLLEGDWDMGLVRRSTLDDWSGRAIMTIRQAGQCLRGVGADELKHGLVARVPGSGAKLGGEQERLHVNRPIPLVNALS